MTNQELHDELLKRVPEFSGTNFYHKDEMERPYNFVSFFGQYLKKTIDDYLQSKDSAKLDIIKRGLEFANTLFDTEDSELMNIANMEVLEYFEESPEAVGLALRYLNNPASQALKKSLSE